MDNNVITGLQDKMEDYKRLSAPRKIATAEMHILLEFVSNIPEQNAAFKQDSGSIMNMARWSLIQTGLTNSYAEKWPIRQGIWSTVGHMQQSNETIRASGWSKDTDTFPQSERLVQGQLYT